jgi:hypothetical protein
MTDHEVYEVLCALAATGQLDTDERATFDAHCMHCIACLDRLRDVTSIGIQLQLDAAVYAGPASLPAGSLERFRARTIRESIAPRSVPARASASYALASAAAFFVMVASLVLMPHGRKVVEGLPTSMATSIATRQNLSASLSRRPRMAIRSKVVHAHRVRYGMVGRSDTRVSDASETAQRFPQAIAASYPYFGPKIATKESGTDYPALNGSQISHLDLFRVLSEPGTRNGVGMATPTRPIDIASTGKVFDFAGQIRQLHFQLPSAQ